MVAAGGAVGEAASGIGVSEQTSAVGRPTAIEVRNEEGRYFSLGDPGPLWARAAGQRSAQSSMMVKVLLYGQRPDVPSSRRIATGLHNDIAHRVLAANNTSDFRTISDFRKDHLQPWPIGFTSR